MIEVEVRKFDKNLELHVLKIKSISQKLKLILDKNIVGICEGKSNSDTSQVKINFLNFLSTKDERTINGAIAEFFVHLYLNEKGFKQEFLFFNLEEGSIKKGFDGYFSNRRKEYIVESKSGQSSTKSVSHKSKLQEAYDDVKSNIEGSSKKSKNNPWKNAYNHASHIDVKTASSIRKKIKNLSDLYDEGKFGGVEEFNIIPTSTIFLDGLWVDDFSLEILELDMDYFKRFKAKSTIIICVTKASAEIFFKYLKEK